MSNFSPEEKVYSNLKNLYDSFGYTYYKMRKFEEYSLYAEYKNFLKNDYIITFTDLSGKLLALKPDITLSIVKNTTATPQKTEKVYYKENVYRLDKNSKTFKEISQIGVELLGNADAYQTLEVIILALKTLGSFGAEFALDISHMGVIKDILNKYGLSQCPDQLKKCISDKSVHDLDKAVAEAGARAGLADALKKLLKADGNVEKALETAASIDDSQSGAIDELKDVCGQLKELGFLKNVNLDFSIVSDQTYYNGIVFQGYVENIPRPVLVGGRYDNLVKEFGKNIGGIGFALYLDDLYCFDKRQEFDFDMLIVYGDKTDARAVREVVQNQRAKGLTVRAEKYVPDNLTFRQKIEV